MKKIYYHGTPANFDMFDMNFAGKNSNQYGFGFYFTSDIEIAKGYALDKEDIGYIKTAKINLENPLIIDGVKEANLAFYPISGGNANKILQYHPALYISQNDEDEMNPLCDYFEDFCLDTRKLTKKDFQLYISKLAYEYYAPTNMKILDIFFTDYPNEFHKAIKEILGIDGLIIKFKTHEMAVAWFSEQIEILSTESVNKDF